MDSFDIHGIRVEKAKAIFRHNKLLKITTLFRIMELCVFLIILSRFCIQLPLAFKLSGDHFRGIFATLISPWFVFVFGNAIIGILFLKSGQSSAKNGVYDEYTENCRKNNYENQKQTNKIASCEYTTSCDHEERKIHRIQSEKMGRMHTEEPHRKLRRSMTVRCRKNVNYGKKAVATSCAEDAMSNEEFRQTVEDFISRQHRFLREEKEFSAAVSHETRQPILSISCTRF